MLVLCRIRPSTDLTTIRSDDLTPFQIRTMIKLDDGHDDFDHVGRMAEELTDNQLIAAYQLAVLGLTECYAGWRGTLWLRLTPAGRRLRENRAA